MNLIVDQRNRVVFTSRTAYGMERNTENKTKHKQKQPPIPAPIKNAQVVREMHNYALDIRRFSGLESPGKDRNRESSRDMENPTLQTVNHPRVLDETRAVA